MKLTLITGSILIGMSATSSPVKRVSIDRIDDVSDTVQVASSPLSSAPGTYADEVVYEFSVPLTTLGLSPSAG